MKRPRRDSSCRGRLLFRSGRGTLVGDGQYQESTGATVRRSRGGTALQILSMTCSEFIESFSDYIDGEGDSATLEAARGHVRDCAACRRYEDVYRRGVALLRSFPEMSVSDRLEPELEVRLRRDTAAAFRQLDRRPPSSGSAMAVVFGMAVILVGAAWAPFVFTRTSQVELAPIVAAYPTRGFRERLPEIDLLPARDRAREAVLSSERLWEEPSALLLQYAPVMQGYARTAVRVGLQ